MSEPKPEAERLKSYATECAAPGCTDSADEPCRCSLCAGCLRPASNHECSNRVPRDGMVLQAERTTEEFDCGSAPPAKRSRSSSCQPRANSSSSCHGPRASSAKKNVYLEEFKCGTFIDDGVTGVQVLDGYSTSSNRSQRSPVSLSSSDDGSALPVAPGPNLAQGLHQLEASASGTGGQPSNLLALRMKFLLR